jgi:CubicO group peptidase (beta-lactamase class C family)
LKKVANEPEKPRLLPDGTMYTPWHQPFRDEPSGLLSFVIRNSWGHGVGKSWVETPTRPLEVRLGDFMADHIFKPLGMKDTGFFTPPSQKARLSEVYVTNPQTGKLLELTSALFPALQDFTKVPPMDSGGGGTVSTVDDYARFCQMILNGGELNGVRILAPATVALMQADHIEDTVTPGHPDEYGPPIGTDALGFGLDFAISLDPAKLGSLQGKGSIWWGGAAGTWFWIDPENDLFFLGMIQRFGGSMTGNDSLSTLSQTLVYQALTNPSK